MSTAYNRRRGAKANRPRTPRQCAHTLDVEARVLGKPEGRCPQVAPVNRYCEEHQRGRA